MDLSLNIEHNEIDLIKACVRQEKWAQKEIYETFYATMLPICMRYAIHSDDARDILHEGFIKVFRNISKYKAGTNLKSWIKRIMVNTAIDIYRKNQKRRTENLENVYHVSNNDVEVHSQINAKEILKALNSLTPSYRMVFNLYVIEGYSHKEIGKILSITESTSRSNLVKARNKLKLILLEMNIEL
jgi:RNA polymerase sigma-70 factor (ECF subfamily)